MSHDSWPNGVGTDTSRRVFLRGVAAAGALATGTVGVAGAHEGEDGGGEPELVTEFEPPELPENIAIDDQGTVYVSLAPMGEIRRVGPDGNGESVASFDVGDGLLLGIVVDDDVIHAAVASGQPDTHGVWRVDLNGDRERVAELPAEDTMPNGIIHDPTDEEALLVTDHMAGGIWRVTPDGAEGWLGHPLLEPSPYSDLGVGADGLAVHPDGDVYVDNLDFGGIVRVPVEDDGSAGDPEVFLQSDDLVGADGMDISENGNIYVAVNAADEVVRITGEAEVETVAAGGDLDFPADVQFGTTEETALYIANFAFQNFLADEAANPSLMRIDAGEQGYFPRADDTAGDEQ